MIIWYLAELYSARKVLRVRFESETATHLFKDGFKISKEPNETRGYFPTFDFAKQYLIDKQQRKVDSLQRRLAEETEKLESLHGLEEVYSDPSQDL
jgi:hypothetical protein